MSEHQRKIELQTNDDLSYLLNNVQDAAQQQINLHLPPSAAQGEDDDFRNKVNALVRQYINDTWESALPSISINGLDAPPTLKDIEKAQHALDGTESHYETFDTRLAQRLRDLYATVEEETTKVAELRREAPKAASQVYMNAITEAIAMDERELEARKKQLGAYKANGLKDISFANQSETKESWDQSRKDLEELRSVTKVKADLERAIRAANEVEKR